MSISKEEIGSPRVGTLLDPLNTETTNSTSFWNNKPMLIGKTCLDVEIIGSFHEFIHFVLFYFG